MAPADLLDDHVASYSEEVAIDLYAALEAQASERGLVVVEVPGLPHFDGAYVPSRSAIRLADGLSACQRLATLAHELGHALLDHTADEDLTLLEAEANAEAIRLMDAAMGLSCSVPNN
jgi:Zn-dependent peptidase ImmA (M78 family)